MDVSATDPPATDPTATEHVDTHRADRPITVLGMVTALGIVYGDLGTSPLYTYQTLVAAAGGHPSDQEAIGLLSLVLWALVLTVSVKYCVLVMRADNQGEGGILALMSLVTKGGRAGRMTGALLAAGLFGATLIYGDGMITPAISVLSAVEGIGVATEALKPYVLPISVLVLVILFAIQPRGTASIGRLFGPVMVVWFLVIGALGLLNIVHEPAVLRALDPTRGILFLATHGATGFVVLGGVFLAVTGGEALYADMAHVGRGPIRAAWYALVLPALLLCYAGQTALLIRDPSAADNPFFKLAPAWATWPLVLLATAATIIASQAIITGAFSLTRQAMQLGWFPGLNIRQTSDTEYGQIYVPVVNWLLMAATLAMTVGFGSSERLAGAFGTAVSTTMLLTTALLYTAMRELWGWSARTAGLVAGLFLVVDLAFFGANLLKLFEGGIIPLLVGAAIYTVMITWRAGIGALRESLFGAVRDSQDWPALLARTGVARVPGTAVFMSRHHATLPNALIQHLAQFKAIQETVVDMTVQFEDVPRVPPSERMVADEAGGGLWHITVRFGFIEIPNVPDALELAHEKGCPLDLSDAVYVASRDAVVGRAHRPRLAPWRRALFTFLIRNAVRFPDRFHLPPGQFVEVIRQVEL